MIKIPVKCSICSRNVFELNCPKCGCSVVSLLHTPDDNEGKCIQCYDYVLEQMRRLVKTGVEAE